MFKRILMVTGFVLAVLTGYAFGQKDGKPLPGGPVFSGADIGFQADAPLSDLMDSGRRNVTGKLVVRVNGRWIEAKSAAGVVPIR